MTDEQWQSVIDTNLTGAFHTIRRATPGMMKARYGRIVNVSSVAGQIGPGRTGQLRRREGRAAGPHAQHRPRARAAEHHLQRRRTRAYRDRDDRRHAGGLADQIVNAVPLGRFGTAEECAAVVAFLCSDAAGYVTGALVPVDGGLGDGPLIDPARPTKGSRTWNAPMRSATIKEVAAEVLSVEPDQVTETARFKEDLDADSLDLVELVMGLEERFDIEVPEDDLEGVTTVGQAVDLVLAKVGS